MTTWSIFEVLRRRWYVLLATAAIGVIVFVNLEHQPGVFSTQTTVYFSSPGSGVSIAQDWQRDSLVAFAAAVERIYDGGRPADRLGEGATLPGSGITEGSSVLLPNRGGQWQNSFATPGLSIKVSGPTSDWVKRELDTDIARISAIAKNLQDGQNVSDENRITTDVSPADPSLSYSATSGSMRLRALAAFGVMGIGIGIGAALAADIIARALRYRRLDRELQLTLAAYRGEI